MNNSIVQAQCVTLKELNDFFISLDYEKIENRFNYKTISIRYKHNQRYGIL